MSTILINLLAAIVATLWVVFTWAFSGWDIWIKIASTVTVGSFAVYGFLRALYIHLLHSDKGRAFLKRIPIKSIQEKANEF